MHQTKIVNIFYASAEELKLGINEMDSEITTALQNGNMEAVKKAMLLKNTMSSLLDNKQKSKLVQETCQSGEKANSSVEITDAMAYAFHAASGDGAIGSDDVEEIKRGLRAVINECGLTNHLVKIPAGLHNATAQLVVNFASEMAGKLYRAQEKYGRGADWAKSDWKDECLKELHRHLSKGDPRDVAAYCMFSWHHGWPTRSKQPAIAGISERFLFDNFMKDDYSPDSSGSVSEEEERVFLEVLFHIWQGRAAVQNGLTQQEMDIVMKYREQNQK